MSERSRPMAGVFRNRGAIICAVMIVELIALVVVHQFFVTFDCGETADFRTCQFLQSLVARSLVMVAAFGVLVWARPAIFRDFVQSAGTATGGAWMWVHLTGLVLLWLPLLLAGPDGLVAFFHRASWFWGAGAALASVGGALWIAPGAAWAKMLRNERFMPLIVLMLAALVPDLADELLPLWDWQAITTATFAAVYWLLSVFSSQTFADPAAYIIGVDSFAVHIARQCSGIEGVALVTAFVCLYALMFRKDIRFPHYWLVVLPVAIMLSLLLNIVRIAVLVLIGARISPELAVNGFHSYAGWLFFTLLALGIVYGLQKVRWLHRDPTLLDRAAPLQGDPVAAQILPFVVFMLSSVIAQALFPHPALGYPLVAISLAGAAWYFRDQLRALSWQLDLVGLSAGALVGLAWVLLADTSGESGALTDALDGLSPLLLTIWVIARLTGTVLLVPLIEEMFFRGYVLQRIDRGGLALRILAIAVSSLLFAALHGRWVAAGLAGLVFALVMLRRGKVGDAVQSHLAANLVVALWALAQFDFALI
ncbi:exosortase E/protease, VPEID-CTERM system [Seohaeicola saemankumensis]|uniref:exosortase E/protease, VPEID-CTERM system n=1 Tax=Seohaeicola TaxID=481178 RepID=UPI0007F48DC4|nr:hypothetical protein A8B83_08550 [Rhodobacteraceae bacterium EhC02]